MTTRGGAPRHDGGERWVALGRVDELLGDGPHALAADGLDVVILRTPSGLRAYEGRCPHQGALLGEGEIDGGDLVCRNHRWRFDASTGKRVGGRECLRACPLQEVDGVLRVDVSPLADGGGARAVRARPIEQLPGPRGWPWIGSFLDFDLERLHLVFEEWAGRYGRAFAVRMGPRPVVVLSDPDHIQPILRARPDTYRRVSTVEAVFEEMGVNGVFSAEGGAWRPQRRLAMEALAARHLRGFYGTLAKVAARLVERWKKAAAARRVLDINEELKRFTVDVTTELVFGYDIDTLGRDDDDVIQRDLEHVFPAFHRRLNALVPYWRYLRLPQDRRLDRALASLRAWLHGRIEEARARLAADEARARCPANFLEAMLAARDESNRPFSDADIFGNALTMLLAGEDTTAYTIAWAVHHLADEDGARRRLAGEADEAMGDRPVPPAIEVADRLAFANAVANEAMRLRPIAPMFFLEPVRDVIVADIAIPRGTGMVLLSRPAAVSDDHFTDARAFRPERWLEGASGFSAHDVAAHIPFGSGPRICPGRALALLEMRVVLASLYKNFRVERVGRTEEVVERAAFTMTPVGLKVRLSAR